MVAQSEIWWLETPNDKRRPVLVVSRDEAIPVLRDVLVAPVTSTIRPIPTNVALGTDEGLPRDCVASFDNLATVPKAFLVARVGALSDARRPEVCRALAAVADC